MARPAHISIHDVAPNTLEAVGDMLRELRAVGVHRVMLLVIPGLPWTGSELDLLRNWFDAGHVPGGHGWTHRGGHRRTLYHKLHGLFLSRHVAEHLALDADGIEALIRRNQAWFGENRLPQPTHYVPPAWAMGSISTSQLDDLPFDTYEFLGGMYHRSTGRFVRMPLQGFEADNLPRSAALRIFNAWNRRRSGLMRLALHPNDLGLHLRASLLRECAAARTRPEPLPEGDE